VDGRHGSGVQRCGTGLGGGSEEEVGAGVTGEEEEVGVDGGSEEELGAEVWGGGLVQAAGDGRTMFGGEENETDICITEETKPIMGRQFWSSVGGRFQAFLNPFLVWVPILVPGWR
jgi:hypothetical protein